MADLNERTRLVVTWGGAVILAGALFASGSVWNEFKNSLAKNAEQDARLGKLEDALVDLKDLVKDGRRVTDAAAKDAATAAANSNGLIYEMGELKKSLAYRGITWPERAQKGDVP